MRVKNEKGGREDVSEGMECDEVRFPRLYQTKHPIDLPNRHRPFLTLPSCPHMIGLYLLPLMVRSSEKAEELNKVGEGKRDRRLKLGDKRVALMIHGYYETSSSLVFVALGGNRRRTGVQ